MVASWFAPSYMMVSGAGLIYISYKNNTVADSGGNGGGGTVAGIKNLLD